MADRCCVFWDASNIYVTAKQVAKAREGSEFGRDLRIHFHTLWELATAGRTVVAGACVGSQARGGQTGLRERLGATVDCVEIYERGDATATEQAVDQALQVHMLRALADLPPSVAVLLTGDGAGYNEGRGFHADLERMYKRGWGIEVLSWNDACNRRLKAWSRAKGTFIALDDFYESIIYLKGVRPPRPLTQSRRLSEPRAIYRSVSDERQVGQLFEAAGDLS